MWHRKGLLVLAMVGLLSLTLAIAAACAGVSQEELDAAKTQAAAQEQKAATLQQQLSTKESELAGLKQQLVTKEDEYAKAKQQLASKEGDAVALQQKLSTTEKEIADIKQKLALKESEASDLQTKLTAAQARPSLEAGSTILLGAKAVPAPTPRPAPTPPPAGYVPPPAPTPLPTYYETLQLYIYADTVTAGPQESKYNYDATGIASPYCVATSAYKRGMHIVWRYEIIDSTTGKRLTTNEVQKASVRLATGEEITGRWGRHGSTPDAPWFWTSAWDVPLDYPLGVLDWSIQVTAKDGKTGSFKQWKVSIPERNIESRTQIVN
ncbi:MAG: hypothetical protein HYY31_02125 [Chloroflexi bacterium]|nr:hypothetical protein [Chloroflexota bacterium]